MEQITKSFTPSSYIILAKGGKKSAKDFLQDVLQQILKDSDRKAEIRKFKNGTFAVFANMPFILDAEKKYRKETNGN